jgi:deazaflavin-dependent oxidoreductase (nitroreductase family)
MRDVCGENDCMAAQSFDDANVFHRAMRTLAATPIGVALMRPTANRLDQLISKATGGRSSFAQLATGVPPVILTTTGAKSGEPRTITVYGIPHRDGVAVIASNWGGTKHPAWYYNLKANPRCSTVFRGQRHEMEAYEAEGEERQRLWELDVSVYPPRNAYARRAGNRRIPVMVLRPVQVLTDS